MKKIRLLSFVLALVSLTVMVSAQNVAISDVSHSADASAVLDVYSTSKGMLVPRLTSTQRTGISSPATGLLVYDTDLSSYHYYDGSSWTELSYGNLWSRNSTTNLTWLTNMNDDVVIGNNTNPANFRFYVYGSTPQVSRFDGKVEFFDVAGGNRCAEIDKMGAASHGIMNLFDGAGTNTISLYSAGNSYFGAGNFGIGTTNPGFKLHVRDQNGLASPQQQIENSSAGATGNTSLNFATTALNLDYTIGTDNSETTFKVCNTPGLNPSAQGDGMTMLRTFKSGIVDFNNQSRARAFQGQNPTFPFGWGQPIPFAAWTPVDFDVLSYDQQFEFALASVPPYSPPGGPAQSFFTATEEGFYQVNARTDFILRDFDTQEEIHNPNYPGYVSIAIFVTDQNGNTSMYAQGNKLQGADNNPSGWNDLLNNLAPNVSDVVYLKQGETIEIWVWQNLWQNSIPLRIFNTDDPTFPGTPPSQTYVSIHKVS